MFITLPRKPFDFQYKVTNLPWITHNLLIYSLEYATVFCDGWLCIWRWHFMFYLQGDSQLWRWLQETLDSVAQHEVQPQFLPGKGGTRKDALEEWDKVSWGRMCGNWWWGGGGRGRSACEEGCLKWGWRTWKWNGGRNST